MNLGVLRKVLAKALPEFLALVPKETQPLFLRRLSRLLVEADDVDVDERLPGLFDHDDEAVAQARLVLDDLVRTVRPPVLADRQAPVHGARYVNTCFTREAGSPALPATLCPGAGGAYFLRVDVGPWSDDSIVENPRPFPVEELGPTRVGYWLMVAATSQDYALDSTERPIFLPAEGRAWTCDCDPGTFRHRCRADDRSPYLVIPVVAPAEAGRADLRLTVTYRGSLVQSQAITTDVRPREVPGFGAHARIDYSLGGLLNRLTTLPGRGVNVVGDQAMDGSHVLTIGGLGPERFSIRLTEGQVDAASRVAWLALRRVKENPGDGLGADLARLAVEGYRLWNLLFGGRFPKRRDDIQRLLREPATIQVGRTSGSAMAFPWALVYDIKLLSDEKDHRPCKIVESMPSPAPPRCPYEAEHRYNVLCPYGFWGMRHLVEQPPSLESDRSLPTRIWGARPSPMVVGVGSRMDDELLALHLARLQALHPAIGARSYAGLAGLMDALAQPDLPLVYLYCHGRRQALPGALEPLPYLEFEGKKLTPSDLTVLHDDVWPKDHWADTSPLVFINSCSSVEITPNSLAHFVDAFCGIYAGGVIGVETVVEQELAGRVAETFWSSFGAGRTVGESLRAVRLQLLGEGDLFGLAYTAYCSTDLRLG
ncbi:hypothetical protein KOI35_32180 [Actinoplanes bogorensis]|uniref:CHAT domain-containing protein n=1 Tax=Paractinoplanes bogorensis TaxID=1610840 RepID=A0ABS5YXK3_9ACTN|nr:hypothetical protein [Actinoplanes bogorensis]MBU2668180.1 hypothetical protein [Actinoplanes bogorensis]